jgi:hypothetical protein
MEAKVPNLQHALAYGENVIETSREPFIVLDKTL